MAQFKFLKGNYSGLNSVAITEGQLLVTKDTRELFVDVDASTRIKIGDFTMIGTLAELEAIDASAVPTSRLYYVEDSNIFCKSTGSAWTQINKDTGATSVEVVGEGNAITDASYDPATRKLTLTKGETFATRAYVGEIPETSEATDIVGYIQEKTAGIATDTALEELTGRVADAEGEIDALQEASANHVEKEEGKSLIADTEIARLAAMSDGANKVEKSETNGNIKVDGAEVVVYTHPEKHAIADVDGLEDRIAAIEGNFGEGEGTVESKIETAVQGVQDNVDDLADKVGELPEGATATTVVGYVDEKVAAETKAREEAVKGVQDTVDAMYTNDQIDTAVQGAKDYAKDLVDALPEQTDYTVTITENTDDATVAKTYVFTQNGAEIGSIKLAKELVVTSGSVKEVETADTPYAGAKVGEKYIELVIANQDTPIYVPAKDLVDIYTAKDGAAEVQVAISNTNEISATLVNGGITEEKLAEGVKTKLNKAHEHTNKELLDTYTQTETDLADAVAKKHEHTNKAELDKIAEGDVAKWNAAEQNAKTYAEEKASAAQSAAEATAAGALSTARTEITAEIDADVKALADGQVATNKADIEALTKTVGDNATAANKAVEDLAATVYTQEQVDELIAEACSWGTFGE